MKAAKKHGGTSPAAKAISALAAARAKVSEAEKANNVARDEKLEALAVRDLARKTYGDTPTPDTKAARAAAVEAAGLAKDRADGAARRLADARAEFAAAERREAEVAIAAHTPRADRRAFFDAIESDAKKIARIYSTPRFDPYASEHPFAYSGEALPVGPVSIHSRPAALDLFSIHRRRVAKELERQAARDLELVAARHELAAKVDAQRDAVDLVAAASSTLGLPCSVKKITPIEMGAAIALEVRALARKPNDGDGFWPQWFQCAAGAEFHEYTQASDMIALGRETLRRGSARPALAALRHEVDAPAPLADEMEEERGNDECDRCDEARSEHTATGRARRCKGFVESGGAVFDDADEEADADANPEADLDDDDAVRRHYDDQDDRERVAAGGLISLGVH